MITIKRTIQLAIVIALAGSCSPGLIQSSEYKIAIRELSYHDDAANYALLPQSEFRKRGFIVYNFDTIYLRKQRKVFGFRHLTNKNIVVYQFAKDGSYKRIKCDSFWSVYQVSEYIGEVNDAVKR